MPVRHSGTRGLGDYVRRGACGYVVRTRPAHCVYVAGDTGYFSGFAEIGRRFHPDVALLPIAGYEPAGVPRGAPVAARRASTRSRISARAS